MPGHSAAIIGDSHLGPLCAMAGYNVDRAFAGDIRNVRRRDGLRCVDDDVENHLIEFTRMTGTGGKVASMSVAIVATYFHSLVATAIVLVMA